MSTSTVPATCANDKAQQREAAQRIRWLVEVHQRIVWYAHEPGCWAGALDYCQPFLKSIEKSCEQWAVYSAAGRWAVEYVGPVLAAGLTVVGNLRNITSERKLLRLFAIDTSRAVRNFIAWKHVYPYRSEAIVPAGIAAAILRECELPPLNDPQREMSPLDLLTELTRVRHSPFGRDLMHWIAAHFRRVGSESTNPYVGLYRQALEAAIEANEMGLKAPRVMPFLSHTNRPLNKEEWQAVLNDRLPMSHLDLVASVTATRSFLLDYWKRARGAPEAE